VGLVVDPGRSARPRTLKVTTGTPGFTAQIEAGESQGGPFHAISNSLTVRDQAIFNLHGGGRYFLVWITDLGGHSSVEVNEVTAR
jgi:hypothetical protein